MLETVDFKPKIKTIGQIPNFSLKEVRDEPMLFSCDLPTALRLGGPITSNLIRLAAEDQFFVNKPKDLNIVIDCRTTLTMPGQYPSIPGWHCDDFNRSVRFAQPALVDRDTRIKHCMTIVAEDGIDISATEFITNDQKIPLDPENVWSSLNDHININKEKFKTKKINNGEVITFSQDSIHRASACINAGWRYFGRISISYRQPANELRKQVQVYTDMTKTGW